MKTENAVRNTSAPPNLPHRANAPTASRRHSVEPVEAFLRYLPESYLTGTITSEAIVELLERERWFN